MNFFNKARKKYFVNFMSDSLQQLHILVTRPDPAGQSLCDYLDAHGARTLHFPTIAFAPPDDTQALQQAIGQLGEQDWIIFNSPQAVYDSVALIRAAWPQFPPSVQFAAVGAGTARALHAAGYIVAVHPADEWSSEGVLDLPEFTHVVGKKIAIVRGEGGRLLLEKTLKTREAQVTPVIAYKRILPSVDMTKIITKLKQDPVNVAICTSYEGVRNLKEMFGEAGWPLIGSLPLIVMSRRIILLARELGFQTLWLAENASHAAILKTLADKKDEICQQRQLKQ